MRTAFLLALWVCAASAQTGKEVLLHQSFAGSTGGWMAVGDESRVEAEPRGPALAFAYTLAPQQLAMLALPAPPSLAHAGRFRFTVKADHATAMALLLGETQPGGGNYMAWFWAPADQWQTVELTPADFTVTDGPDDPVDADAKLDLNAVESIGILDLAQFFGTLKAAAPLPVRIADAFGPHKLLLQSFELLAGSAPARKAAFDRGFLDWVSPGAMQLRLSESGNPLGERSLEASYQHHDGELDLLVHREGGAGAATKPTRLAFDIASERDVTLVVSLEMKKPGGGEGARYTLPIFPPGGREVFHVDLKLADFKGPDKFDPAQWRTTAILDVTEGDGANTIWIGNVRALGN